MHEDKDFFWLHIKKSGGESFRETFSPPYVQTDRVNNYKCFIALPKEEWNDALNNYRIPLGEYDYKRMLFAKKFLYSKQEFESMYKFVIVRNPYDRAVSAWKYLPWFKSKIGRPKRTLMKYNFEYFLKQLPVVWKTKVDRHMATHTAPIWGDITDESGSLLVDDIFKLENINEELIKLNDKLGLKISQYSKNHNNKRRKHNNYRKFYNKKTKALVEEFYKEDIEQLEYQF